MNLKTWSTNSANAGKAIRTERLRLRPWRVEDYGPYAALNADSVVRRWWSTGTLSRAESDAQADRLRRRSTTMASGSGAVEVPGVSDFIGFVGLLQVGEDMPFGPTVEAGWRLAQDHWGQGYATEGARAALDDELGLLGFPEMVAFAVEGNMASRRVMERIGMRRDPADDFDHPLRPVDDPMRRQVLYRANRELLRTL